MSLLNDIPPSYTPANGKGFGSMTDELKPCPFCGGEATVSSETCGWRVDCIERDCYTRGPWPDDCTEDEAIEAWNTRTPLEDQA